LDVSIPNIAFVEGDPVAFENIANLLGTQERPAIFGGKDRMNEKMSEGLAHAL
jgi:hypothetical protein